MPNSTDFYKRIFLHVIPACIVVPCHKVENHFCVTISFISIQPVNELSYPFHLTHSLLPFLLNYFSNLNSFWSVFCNSFLLNLPTTSSPLQSLIKYVDGTVFLTYLITKIFFGMQIFEKMFLYFNILIWSPTSNLGSFLLFFLSKSTYMFEFI